MINEKVSTTQNGSENKISFLYLPNLQPHCSEIGTINSASSCVLLEVFRDKNREKKFFFCAPIPFF